MEEGGKGENSRDSRDVASDDAAARVGECNRAELLFSVSYSVGVIARAPRLRFPPPRRNLPRFPRRVTRARARFNRANEIGEPCARRVH